MVELWIPITIVAAFMQNARSALQKHLKGRLSTLGATYVRFLYALPFAILYVAALDIFGGKSLPEPNRLFFLYVVLGGIALCATQFIDLLIADKQLRVGLLQALLSHFTCFGKPQIL